MKEDTMKTTVRLPHEKYVLFRTIASALYDHNFMNQAFNESVELFIEKNKHVLSNFTEE
jgi:hypothetical protein